jgi:hypothetical protein
MDFGFAVNQRQTVVKCDYRKKAGKFDAEYHQPGDATTLKSILNEHSKGGEVLSLVVGYSLSASAAPGVTPLHVDSRGSSWIACGTTWTRRPALAIGGASWTLTLNQLL